MTMPSSSKIIDIVIPVYKGLRITARCIESVLNSAVTIPYEIVVIDDCSPEPELSQYLKELAAIGKITLLVNPENKGFVHSVNRGMKLHGDRDILLLNSDTCVANDWLDRMQHCAYADSKIATVTPFSNNATICSYPKFCESNELPAEYDIQKLDQLFSETNTKRFIQIPTAVGFCMYIKRDTLNTVGFFDEERFGKGYGEENDFCLRSEKKGWKHVIACDVFVFHEGSVSFGASKNERIEQSSKILNKLYPKYLLSVQNFILKDRLRFYRTKIDIKRLFNSRKPTYLQLMHNGEGGVLKHINDLANNLNDQINFLLLKPLNKGIRLIWCNPGESLNLFFSFSIFDQLIDFLNGVKVQRLHIHHTRDWNQTLKKIIAAFNVPFDITIHDYYSFCPQISLTTKNGKYCELPDVRGCQECVKNRFETRRLDIVSWRQSYQNLLAKAERIFVPSQIVIKTLKNYFENVNFIFAPHPDLNFSKEYQPNIESIKPGEKLKVLVLGALSQIKGAEILEKCAALAKRENLPIEFHLLGFAYRRLKTSSQLIVHGSYQEQKLQELIQKINPHLAWFPSQWPETYSYTLSSCFQAQLPVVSTDLGAQAERIEQIKTGIIKSWKTTPEEWNKLFLDIRKGIVHFDIKNLLPQNEVEQFNYQYHYAFHNQSDIQLSEPPKGFWDNYNNFIRIAFKKDRKSLRSKLFTILSKFYVLLGLNKIISIEKLRNYKLLLKI